MSDAPRAVRVLREKIARLLTTTRTSERGIAVALRTPRAHVVYVRKSLQAQGRLPDWRAKPARTGRPGVLSDAQRAEVRSLMAQGFGDTEIARRLGCNRDPVARLRAALRADGEGGVRSADGRLADDEQEWPGCDHAGFLEACRAAYPGGPPADAAPAPTFRYRAPAEPPAGASGSPAAMCAEV